MIDKQFIKYTPRGLYCASGDFFIDPKKPVPLAVISHAHADHAVPGNEKIFCTNPTKAIMQKRYGSKAGVFFNPISFGSPFYIGEVKLCFYPAGHILGSAQILMEYNSVKYLYTGDFKLQLDVTCETFQFINADVLITETTFAHPDHHHPDADIEILKLNELTGRNIMLGAYTIGKAQRITSLISRNCLSKRIMVHSSISHYQKLYEDFNISLGNWEPYRRAEMKANINCVYIVPPFVFKKYINNPAYFLVFASGWEQLQSACCISLKISDHADWKDILLLIEKISPRYILTIHGDGLYLKNHLIDSGIEVEVLN
jgi:putative mRNA 3-end processing factor